MIIAFIDTMRAEGVAVESICRVLREQGCQIAARTYRAWRSRRPAARTISDAQTVDAVREVAWRVDHQGRRRLTPEGLYGRVKMRALLDRTSMPGVDEAQETSPGVLAEIPHLWAAPTVASVGLARWRCAGFGCVRGGRVVGRNRRRV